MNIIGNKVILRAIEHSDLQLLQEMLNDPEIEKMVVGWSFPVSFDDQERWFLHQKENKNTVRFIVEYENAPVGLVSLSEIDWKNRKATASIKLHTSCPKGKGIGTDSVLALHRYAFDELNLNRLEGAWLTYNQASESLHLKCGWKIEGIQREAVFKNGKYHDLKVVGILKSDYIRTLKAPK